MVQTTSLFPKHSQAVVKVVPLTLFEVSSREDGVVAASGTVPALPVELVTTLHHAESRPECHTGHGVRMRATQLELFVHQVCQPVTSVRRVAHRRRLTVLANVARHCGQAD